MFHVDHIFLNLRGNQSHQCSLAVDRLCCVNIVVVLFDELGQSVGRERE